MKRYDLVTNYRAGSSIEEMEPSEDGEWIRYEDHEAIVAGYEQRMALINWWSERCRDIRNGSPNAFYEHVDAFCKALQQEGK